MPSVINQPLTFVVRQADWPEDEGAVRCIREAVFVSEQSVPMELEWDGKDPHCRHVLALDSGGQPIGTGRLLADGHIGRMAVLPGWRNRGVGSALLSALIHVARAEGMRELVLNAQVGALPFYRRHGFEAVGGEFIEAGIAHRRMRRLFTAKSS